MNKVYNDKVSRFTQGAIAEILHRNGLWMFGDSVADESVERIRRVCEHFLFRYDKYLDVMSAALYAADYVRYGRQFVCSCYKHGDGFGDFYRVFSPSRSERYRRALVALAGKPLQIVCENMKLRFHAGNIGTEAEPCICIDVEEKQSREDADLFWLDSEMSKWDNRVPNFLHKMFTVPKSRKTRRKISGDRKTAKRS